MQDPSNPSSPNQAQSFLKDTDSAVKNELLFSRFGINYTHTPAQFRKGSVVYRKHLPCDETSKTTGAPVVRMRRRVVMEHVDLIRDVFWNENKDLL